jgi:hypothetical protein
LDVNEGPYDGGDEDMLIYLSPPSTGEESYGWRVRTAGDELAAGDKYCSMMSLMSLDAESVCWLMLEPAMIKA